MSGLSNEHLSCETKPKFKSMRWCRVMKHVIKLLCKSAFQMKLCTCLPATFQWTPESEQLRRVREVGYQHWTCSSVQGGWEHTTRAQVQKRDCTRWCTVRLVESNTTATCDDQPSYSYHACWFRLRAQTAYTTTTYHSILIALPIACSVPSAAEGSCAYGTG